MPLRDILSMSCLALAGLIACVNFYLTLLRYPLHRLRGGSRETYRFVSGIPMIGTILLLFAGVFAPASEASQWMLLTALVIFVADTGGLLWLGIAMVLMWLRPPEGGA